MVAPCPLYYVAAPRLRVPHLGVLLAAQIHQLLLHLEICLLLVSGMHVSSW